MRLDEFVDIEANERAERRRLAKEKSYEILDYVEGVADRVQQSVSGDAVVGSVSPSIFVGGSNYPNVSTGILSPVGDEGRADSYATSGAWYEEGIDLDEVFRRRTGLLNSRRSTPVDAHDAWDGFVGVGREVAIADRPVDVEIGLDCDPSVEFDADGASAPTGPSARARSAHLGENPHVPRAVEKTLEDDDWRAEGAINYLYRRGFDVYEVNTILSAGALGRRENRRLVPTRWSITAVDDTVGGFLRGSLRDASGIDEVEIHHNDFLGNAYWVILAPGKWEYELVEMKAPGSVWNPDPEAGMYLAADSEGREGRTGYVEETAGAYHAARLAVLEHLDDRGRQGKALVLRHVSDDYWGPVGVWQVREAVRDAFAAEHGSAETFAEAVRGVADHLPVSLGTLRRKSTMAAGLQTTFGDFG
jgi:hypothetical protein